MIRSTFVFIMTAIMIFGVKSGLYADKEAPQWIIDSILKGELSQIESTVKLELSSAHRLIRQIDRQEIYSSKGKIIKRTYPDGTKEIYRYSSKQSMVSVWVTSDDGKMIEERAYLDGILKSIIYADGSLKTFQYQPKDEKQIKDEAVYQIFFYSGDKVRLFQYDRDGLLVNAFLQDGRLIPRGNLTDFYHIGSLINPELLRIGVTD